MDVIQPGVAAPDFQGLTQDGQPISLATFRGRPVILFFYPKANSGGCSTEARGFAEHYTEFQRAGMDVIGISVDSIEEQKRFAENCHLPFPLVADHDKSIARQYGVLGFLGIAQRVTFFLDADGKVVERVEGLLPTRHVQRALERLSESRPPP
ncbi:MAG: peroxiredoxin [Thermoplasmata archaeon]|nr:peroxiredoxin [Thermoplasmata archaeon]